MKGGGRRRRVRARARAGGGGGGCVRRAAANARERQRTHSVNAAFGALRRLIPTRPPDRRLSKVETLRLAAGYIAHLGNVLRRQRRDGAAGQTCPRSSCPQPCTQPPPSPSGSAAPRPICTFCLSERRHWEREKPLSGPALSGH